MPKIAVISDYPTVEEVGAPYQGGASMQMKNALKSAFAMMDSSLGRKEVGYFYLSPVRFQQGLDTEVFSAKELPKEVRKDFNCVEYLPETYISDTLNDYFTALLRDLREFQPDIIVCSGKWSLYFFGCYTLSDKNIGKISSVKGTKRAFSTFGLNIKFRGSLLKVYDALDLGQVICIPMIPHAYQFQITARKAIEHDYLKIAWTFEKIKEDGNKDYFLNYTPDTTVFEEFEEARVFLTKLLNRLNKEVVELSVDLETVGKTIDTIGYAFDEHKGYAIPLLRATTKKTKKYKDTAYDKKGKEVQIFLGSTTRTFERVFSCFEEAVLVHLNKKILTHPNARLIGQNFHYDCLIFQDTWGIEVHPWVDTLVLAHCLRNTDKKGLAYLCSLYLDRYAYWKDDLNATNSIDRWHYCAKDSLFTFALKNCLLDELSTRDPQNQAYYWNKQNRTAKNVLRRMFDGLTVDIEVRRKQDEEFSALFESAINQIQLLVGYPVNIRSTPQMRKLLIDVLGIEPVLDRKRKTPTFGNAAMLKYCARYPEYAYLLYLILEAKSIATYLQNFIKARLDDEGKLRSFIGVAGTKSNRFSSKKFLNGVGANVMNWSTGKNSLVYTVMAIEHAASESDYSPEEEEEEDSDVIALAQQESKLALVPNSKMIIIPSSPDKKFVNVDLSSGDLYYVTWMADAKFNKEILGNGGDVYTVLGSKYFNTKLEKSDPRRKKFKAVCHACVTEDHEVLTPNGWIYIKDLTLQDQLAVWDTNFKVKFEYPLYINEDFVSEEEDLYAIEGTSFSFLGTQDHAFPATTDAASNIRRHEASKLPKSARIPYSGKLNSAQPKTKTLSFIRLIVALQADGHVSHIDKNGEGYFVFRFTKERKITRLEEILTSLEISYDLVETKEVSSQGNIIYRLSFKGGLDPAYKKLGWYSLNWSEEELETFVTELIYWDGCSWEHKTNSSKREEVSTICPKTAEIWQTLIHLTGRASKLLVKTVKGKNPCYIVSINNRNFFNLSSATRKEKVSHGGTKVYCPQTSTGYFIFRRNGHIAVSGNTNYLGMPRTIALLTGLAELEVLRIQNFYFNQNPEIVEYYQNKIINDCLTLGYTTNIFGARYWCETTDEKRCKTWRQQMVALPAQGSVADVINEVMDRACEGERGENYKLQTNLFLPQTYKDAQAHNGLLLPQEYPMKDKLQIHDAGLWEVHKKDTTYRERINEYFKVELPFTDRWGKPSPLIIPWDISESEVSYAGCK